MTESRRDPGWFRLYWPLLLLVGVPALFGVPQGLALWFPGAGGTASEWTRDVLGVAGGAPGARFWVFLTCWIALALWFPLHLLRWWPWERRR